VLLVADDEHHWVSSNASIHIIVALAAGADDVGIYDVVDFESVVISFRIAM
jgi:hypothetical protein